MLIKSFTWDHFQMFPIVDCQKQCSIEQFEAPGHNEAAFLLLGLTNFPEIYNQI